MGRIWNQEMGSDQARNMKKWHAKSADSCHPLPTGQFYLPSQRIHPAVHWPPAAIPYSTKRSFSRSTKQERYQDTKMFCLLNYGNRCIRGLRF